MRRIEQLIQRRRGQRLALGVLGAAVLAAAAATLAPHLAPLVDLVERGAATLVTLAGEAPTSPVAAALLGALVLSGAALSWTLRRL